jgi:GT2 family glycosyltransferase
MLDLAISIVLFHNSEKELLHVVDLINNSPLKKRIYLIDNSADDRLRKFSNLKNVEYVFLNANVGYGSGHNIAMRKAKDIARCFLIMNADVDFHPDILNKAFIFLENNPNVGLLSPQIHLFDGTCQYFCRRLPTPFDLFARRFIPAKLKPLFKKALDDYILLDRDYSKPMNIPNLPGCFMFTRMSALNEVGGFDENFFMYCEDIDLTRRLHQQYITLYYPELTIKHGLARGSYKFSKLVLYHIKSAIYYFNKWGWFFDSDRKKVNNKIQSINPKELRRGVHEINVLFKSAV